MPQNKQKKDEFTGGDQLPGWPGYRTRPNRSGLDPLDSRAEAGHVGGIFLRSILTLKATTRKPFYLLLMFVFGVIPFPILVVLVVSEIIKWNPATWISLIYPALFLLVTGALTINFLLSILEILGVIPSHKTMKPIQSRAKAREKKLPKRRKNHR
jgi:hypothetical protein